MKIVASSNVQTSSFKKVPIIKDSDEKSDDLSKDAATSPMKLSTEIKNMDKLNIEEVTVNKTTYGAKSSIKPW